MDPALAERARRAATAIATELGGEVHEVVDLQDSNRLTVRLLPCDTVARIGPTELGGADVEVERAARLTEAGAPVGPLDRRFPARVHRRDGFDVTLWTFLPSLPRPAVPALEYAHALADLHAALRAADLPAPSLTERVGSALALLRDPERTPALPAADRELLLTVLTDLSAAVTSRGEQQTLHGEPHPGNLIDTPDGPRFIDLETLCRGPGEFDLAHAPADVSAHYPGADPALLADCRTLSLALATTWRWDREDTLPDGRRLGEEWLAEVCSLVGR